MNRQSFTRLLVCLCAVAGLSAQAQANMGVDTPDPNLPPTSGFYMVDGPTLHAIYGPAVFTDIIHRGFVNITRTTVGPNEVENFDSQVSGNVSVSGGPPVPVSLLGPVSVTSFGKVGMTTGTFSTEMTSMLMSGPTALGPLMIRESPTLASTGMTSISNIGGGMFHIDSFFDVFTELSVDGGQQWIPSQGPTHVVLCTPEPTSIVLLSLGLVSVVGLARRRK